MQHLRGFLKFHKQEATVLLTLNNQEWLTLNSPYIIKPMPRKQVMRINLLIKGCCLYVILAGDSLNWHQKGCTAVSEEYLWFDPKGKRGKLLLCLLLSVRVNWNAMCIIIISSR